jgi:hypothetical protein
MRELSNEEIDAVSGGTATQTATSTQIVTGESNTPVQTALQINGERSSNAERIVVDQWSAVEQPMQAKPTGGLRPMPIKAAWGKSISDFLASIYFCWTIR